MGVVSVWVDDKSWAKQENEMGKWSLNIERQDTEVGTVNSDHFCREFKWCAEYPVLGLWEIQSSKAHAWCPCLQRALTADVYIYIYKKRSRHEEKRNKMRKEWELVAVVTHKWGCLKLLLTAQCRSKGWDNFQSKIVCSKLRMCMAQWSNWIKLLSWLESQLLMVLDEFQVLETYQ